MCRANEKYYVDGFSYSYKKQIQKVHSSKIFCTVREKCKTSQWSWNIFDGVNSLIHTQKKYTDIGITQKISY